MCLILFAYQHHSQYPLILAANRDENYKRPTAPANFWRDQPHVLAGRDLKQMGTWLGVTTAGRFAAITNYRGSPDSRSATGGSNHTENRFPTENGAARNMISRGKVVSDYLSGQESPREYLNNLKHHRTQYNGFNVIIGDPSSCWYYSNIQDVIQPLTPGIYGISNHLLDTPWPKVNQGKKALEKAITRGQIDVATLFDILYSSDPAEDKDLPETGVGLEMERLLSPIFIQTDDYGTRSSTVLTIDRNGHIQFFERSFTKTGNQQEVCYEFEVDA